MRNVRNLISLAVLMLTLNSVSRAVVPFEDNFDGPPLAPSWGTLGGNGGFAVPGHFRLFSDTAQQISGLTRFVGPGNYTAELHMDNMSCVGTCDNQWQFLDTPAEGGIYGGLIQWLSVADSDALNLTLLKNNTIPIKSINIGNSSTTSLDLRLKWEDDPAPGATGTFTAWYNRNEAGWQLLGSFVAAKDATANRGFVIFGFPFAPNSDESGPSIQFDLDKYSIRIDGLYDPLPADGASVALTDDVLSWSYDKMDPNNTVYFDVYFNDTPGDPNFVQLIAEGTTQQSVDLSELTPPILLEQFNEYEWYVDANEVNVNGDSVVLYNGPVWSFNTNNLPPVIDNVNDIYTWLGRQGTAGEVLADLPTPTITDDGLPEGGAISYVWELLDSDDAIDPNSFATAGGNLNPTFTITGPIDDPDYQRAYTIQFTATDGELESTATMVINVTASACAAAKADPSDVLSPVDLNSDCFVNLEDLALLAADWLYCMSQEKFGCTP